MNRVAVEPGLLRWASERSGISADSLRRRFPKFEAWENKEVRPTLKQIEAFAKVVHVPVGYLFLSTPPDEVVPIPDLRTVEGRALGVPSPDLLDTLYICQRRQVWYVDYARSMGEEPLGFIGSAREGNSAVAVAAKMRDALSFDTEARRRCPTWTDALRLFIEQADSMGMLVMVSGVVGSNNHRKLDPQEFRSFALVDTLAPLVFVNGADAKAVQMFTLNTDPNCATPWPLSGNGLATSRNRATDWHSSYIERHR